jgi:hypothetical protein
MVYELEKPDMSKVSDKRKSFIMENLIDLYVKNSLNKYSDEKYLFWDCLIYNLPGLYYGYLECKKIFARAVMNKIIKDWK